MVAIILLGAFTFHSPLVAFLLLPPFSPPLPSKSSLVSGDRCKLPWLRTHYDAFKALKTHLVAKIRIFRRINHSTRYRPQLHSGQHTVSVRSLPSLLSQKPEEREILTVTYRNQRVVSRPLQQNLHSMPRHATNSQITTLPTSSEKPRGVASA